jgi:hypothetical protein
MLLYRLNLRGGPSKRAFIISLQNVQQNSRSNMIYGDCRFMLSSSYIMYKQIALRLHMVVPFFEIQ